MKNSIILPIILLGLISCNQNHSANKGIPEQVSFHLTDSADMTNNFYDNTETFPLPVKELTIEGEIANPGKADFSKLPVHSLIVKETLLDSSGMDKFVGAYRYDGYSLFDILNDRILRKSNSEEFNPIIDIYVEVENDSGEKVVFSWGEIYYPNNLHRIIIATSVSRIVPSKTGELWELPGESKLVAGDDLITERNISSPVRITVKSFPKSFPVKKGLSPIYSRQMKIFKNGEDKAEIISGPVEISEITFNTIFYGRGRGIHSTQPFKGVMLKDLLREYYPVNKSALQTGLICIAGEDGYRCALSFSEIFNRNDQKEFLIVKTAVNEDGGLFRLFAASDFFSDRAIKSVSEIHFGY